MAQHPGPRAGPISTRALSDGQRSKYAQLSDVLTDLAAHRLGHDQPIPSERDLMATYDLSRGTVRKAIDGLVAKGLLHRVQGKGTFVTRPRLKGGLHLASFSQDMRGRGLTPSSTVLALEVDTPPADVARALGLRVNGSRPGAAWHLERVRLADGRPIALENGWYPKALLPGLDREDLADSLYRLFADTYGLTVNRAEQTLWGEAADPATARRLDAPLHTPLLVFRRVSYAGEKPLEHVVSRYRGDRYQLYMSLRP